MRQFTDSGWKTHEKDMLLTRELFYKRGYRPYRQLGFTKERLRWVDRSNVKIDHDGCVNTVKWSSTGDLLYTGSDDRKVKIWRLGSSMEEIKLCHTIETRHRGNIFCAEPSPLHDNLVISAAADGYIRSNYIENNNTGNSLLSSTDMIHMFKFDIDQPNIIYSAEEAGYIHRIDLRYNNSKELLFENKGSCYRNSPIYNDDETIRALLPQWNANVSGAVKAIIQTPTISSPHLIIGGKGLVIGMLDLRITNRQNLEEQNTSSSTSPPALLQHFTKMWSPLFAPVIDSPKKQFLVQKYSDLSWYHPWSMARFDSEDVKKSLPPMYNHLEEAIAISGLDVSKDGKRILASYRNDQIYTFNLTSKESVEGIDELIGGHINYATFLKSVHFFGPNDEYVVSGSDSGHMWMWEASSVCPSAAYTVCPIVTVMKADNRTCNGVVPHPTAPILASYGIDSDAKLWAFRTFDSDEEEKNPFSNINEAEAIKYSAQSYAAATPENPAAPNSSTLNVNSKAQRYYMCKHLGPRDVSKYTRYSLPLLLYNPKSAVNMMTNLPYLLESNKIQACSLNSDRIHNTRNRRYPEVLSPFAFNDTVYCLRNHFLEQNKNLLLQQSSDSSAAVSNYEILNKDVGHFMPSETLFDVLDLYDYTSLNLEYYKERMSFYVDKLKLQKNVPLLSITLQKFYDLLLQRNTLKRTMHYDFFHYLEYNNGELLKQNRVLYYLFIPYLEFLRVIDIAKMNGNEAYKRKELDSAHYFYCKAIRYASSMVTLNFVDLISEEDEKKKKKSKTDQSDIIAEKKSSHLTSKKKKSGSKSNTSMRIISGTIAASAEGEMEMICGGCVTIEDEDEERFNQLTGFEERVNFAVSNGTVNRLIRDRFRDALRDTALPDSLLPLVDEPAKSEKSVESIEKKSDSSDITESNEKKIVSLEDAILGEIEEDSDEDQSEENEDKLDPLEVSDSSDRLEKLGSSDDKESERNGVSDAVTISSSFIANQSEGGTLSPDEEERFSPATPQSMEIDGSEGRDDVTTATADKTDNSNPALEKSQVHTEVVEEEFDESINRHNITKLCFRIVRLIHNDIVPDLLYTLFNNLALTFIAMEKYQDGLGVCDDGIQFAAKYEIEVDAKLLFRRGTVNLHLHNYEDAMEDLQKAMTLNPKDNAIQLKFKEAKRLHDMKRKREMKVYSKMFAEE